MIGGNIMENIDFKTWYEQQIPNPALLKQRLTYLQRQFQMDSKRIEKLKKLQQKLEKFEWCIAFSGHFSAGKSTLINTILDVPLLPNSPIPTSANIVTVQKGNASSVMVIREDDQVEHLTSFEDVSKYAKENDIKEINLHMKEFPLPESFVLMDTPGLDSTIESHQQKALDALFFADVIIYMMDYRHVESKENVEKIKKIESLGKKVLLVVNQIDKHQQSELPFHLYKENVFSFLKRYTLDHLPIYFLSLKNFELEENEWEMFTKDISHYLNKRKQTVIETITKAMYILIEEHQSFLFYGYKEEFETLSAKISYRESPEMLRKRIQKMEKQLQEYEERPGKFEKTTTEQINRLLWYANIMPYHTRERVREFIEANQVDFRVKGFFSKRKTAKERQRRLQLLLESLKENTFIYLMLPTKKILTNQFKEYRILTEDFKEKIQDFTVELNASIVLDTFKTSALYNEEYVQQFCRDISKNVQRLYRNDLYRFIEQGQHQVQISSNFERKRLVKQLTDYHERLRVNDALEKMEQQIASKITLYKEKTIMKSIEPIRMQDDAIDALFYQVKHKNASKKIIPIDKISKKITRVPFQTIEIVKEDQLLAKAKETVRVIREISPLRTRAKRLEKKTERVENKLFTLVLFGAFSSGKSSFANALLGEEILPVSPNPTTATINKVCPPNEQHLHRTVEVVFKTKEELLLELNQLLKTKNVQLEHLHELDALLLREETMLWLNQTELEWLHVINLHYKKTEKEFGKVKVVDIDTFEMYVKKEEYAAFIKEIKLYYDCALTREGIILVDTPGADSIHLRHTETAFQFLTESDAVFYVMYYNHSFSRFDRDFLMQIGRVKEQFDKEKIFFILNACDLAEKENEILLVVDHLKENLRKMGVKESNVYPVSSHYEKQGEKEHSGFQTLSKDLFSFIIGQLQNEALYNIQQDIDLISQTLSHWYALSLEHSEKRGILKRELMKKEEKAVAFIESLTFKMESKWIKEEIHELMYYVKQRIFYRYYDEFKLIFSAQQFKREISFQTNLRKCVIEMIQFLQYDLMQEMRATSFRIHMYINRTMTEITKTINDQLRFFAEDLSLYTFEKSLMEPPILEELLTGLDEETFRNHYTRYSNTTDFFVKNGDLLLREEMEKEMREPLRLFISNYQTLFDDAYATKFEQLIPTIKQFYIEQIHAYFAGEMSALSLEYSPDQLKKMIEQLKN